MSQHGIQELKTLRLMHSRFRSIFVLLGLLSLCLVVYLSLRAMTGRLYPHDIVYIALLVLASLALCVAQVRCLRVLSLEATRRIETMALFDDLTGVYNYRYMDFRLREELSRSDRTGRPVAVIYIDLDRFKQVNDKHGHQVGNEVLRRVGRLLKSNARSHDLVGRLGGDEFFLILPETRVEETTVVAERLRKAMHHLVYRSREGTTIDYLRVSIGIAGYPRDAEDVDELLNQADRAMYMAKKEGGDAVTLATVPESCPSQA